MERLEQEKTIPICKNCHSIKQATVFNKYSEIITRKNSFENTIEGLEKNIHQYMRSQLKYEKFDQIKQVKPWIKKRIVTEKLFNGKCVGCGEDKLPSLQFHHRDPKQKTYQKWSDLSNLSTSKIINKLKEDNAICLCANCHSMTESRHLEQNLGEILEKPEMNELVTYYKEIHQKINNYSFPNQPELLSKKSNRLERNQHVQSKKVRVNRRLESKKTNYILSNPKNNTGVKKSLFSEKQIIAKLNIDLNSNTELFNNRFQNREFRYGEAWKKYLSHITKLLNEGKEVQTKNLAESVGVNARNTRKNIQKLITKGLISINGEHNNRTIILTEKGRTELEIN